MDTTLTLRIVCGPYAGAEYSFTAPAVCVIGRAPNCELRLSGGLLTETLSRHHCRIELTPLGAFVQDLGSRNGTALNGVNIGQRPPCRAAAAGPAAGPRHELADGDVLRVGGLGFRVRMTAGAGARAGADGSHAAAAC